jgi:gliding motility-associated lipoprotein GldD
MKIRTGFFLYIFNAFLFAGSLLLTSCNENYTPKPRGFFRIGFPEQKYVRYSDPVCPFEFEIPVYASVKAYRDSMREPCWKYISIPQFNAEVFLSYHNVNGDLSKYLEDARTLAYKHAVKASAIDETPIHAAPGISGMIYDIGGAAASSVQFFITDSSRHFMRGALYFNASPQPDSLAPVIAFLRKDIENMIFTARWK